MLMKSEADVVKLRQRQSNRTLSKVGVFITNLAKQGKANENSATWTIIYNLARDEYSKLSEIEADF